MPVYTVSQVTAYIRDLLDRDSLLSDLWISGEVSNLTLSQAGHTYFTLKDAQGQLRCVMFQGGKGAELLTSGGAVIAHGRITFYEARGLLEFQTDLVVPEGTGPLYLEYERLKMRLEAEGLFDPTRKRPLPAFPRVIGVVTSPVGAVFHDICNIIRRRYPLVELLLAPTPVQGEGAASGIVAALKALNLRKDVDVVIVARGGGTIEELWPFNEEAVARAIYASRAPVVSGIGHETDFTIADLVADVRAPTPSAAAEMVVPDAAALRQRVAELEKGAQQALSALFSLRRQELGGLLERLERAAPDVEGRRREVEGLERAASLAIAGHLNLLGERVSGLEKRLRALSPRSILDRGYAIVQREPGGEVVRRVGQVHPGDTLRVTVSDGAFPARAGSPSKRRETRVYAGRPLL